MPDHVARSGESDAGSATGWQPPRTFDNEPDSYRLPVTPHRVVGNLYAVGTHALGVFLITTPDGHILINTGLRGSADVIGRNVEQLGFRLQDVAILLCMQSHWDHAAALAEIKRRSGARLLATAGDTRTLQDGGLSDPHFGGGQLFEPVAVDGELVDGDLIELGGVQLRVHLHPGHTEGSSSYSMNVADGERSLAVLVANMPTVNAGKRLLVDPTYPNVAQDFADTFAKMKALEPDIWVSSHGNHYGLADKFVPGDDAATRANHEDPQGYRDAVERLERKFLDLLEIERSR